MRDPPSLRSAFAAQISRPLRRDSLRQLVVRMCEGRPEADLAVAHAKRERRLARRTGRFPQLVGPRSGVNGL